MPPTSELKIAHGSSAAKCLARSVVEAFAAEPQLEAVTIDPARKTISVATLGKTKLPQAADRVRQTIEETQLNRNTPCTLLAGSPSCQTCDQPLSDAELQNITIRHNG